MYLQAKRRNPNRKKARRSEEGFTLPANREEACFLSFLSKNPRGRESQKRHFELQCLGGRTF
jgi:hypothetical protein